MTHRISFPACKPQPKRSFQDMGAAMVAALVAMFLLLISSYILASRSFWFFNGSLKTSDFRTSQDIAEFGASEMTNMLNRDENGYLLVVQPTCWQSASIDKRGFYNATPGPDKIIGVLNNQTPSLRWRIVPLASGQSPEQAVQSGTYARYQLSEYRPPRRINSSIEYSLSESTSNCPSDPFANRLGGSAFLTIRAELYRRNQLVSEHTLTQEVHVKGSMMSSTGETSVVLTQGGAFNTSKPFLDKDGDDAKDADEPWLNIFCVFCTGTTPSQLRTGNPPVGVGFQGVMANQYNGTITTGEFVFPRFRFQDSNGNYIQDPAEKNVHQALINALPASIATSPPSLDTTYINSTPGGGSTYPYKTNSYVDSNLRNECAVVTDNVTDPANPYQYIGCLVNNISLASGPTASITVRTNQTGGKPVYIFVQGSSVEINGNDALVNENPDKPLTLGLFGLPPTTVFPTPEPTCSSQQITLSGTPLLRGFWIWFPRGSLDPGSGNLIIDGIMWICSLNGNGNFRFLGSNQDITSTGCGENMPCGIYVYRARGIAQVDRAKS